ncbi:hypothetical protein HYE82_18375 [Streptomyces sp. BR123]|uniref:hypothetical protein n=1 Tax=Streptomyces sp. BR123 TaxID=2749828 RepID=UPI0015C4BDE7|nr:hypothetical protein [Streptomyces sp. BR123]NXY96318.1 hypothetical protein [Streptomyces sp. BR123]
MSIVRVRTLVRVAAVSACAGGLLVLTAAGALAEGMPAASTARTLVKRVALADGVSRAEVYRGADGAYQADVLGGDGAKAATLHSGDRAVGIGGGELHADLRADGRITSWVGDRRPGTGHAPDGRTPAGHSPDGHKTGTRDGVVVAAPDTEVPDPYAPADEPGDGMLLLAAGGGIASAGAAGLGYAMLRRGRTDS